MASVTDRACLSGTRTLEFAMGMTLRIVRVSTLRVSTCSTGRPDCITPDGPLVP